MATNVYASSRSTSLASMLVDAISLLLVSLMLYTAINKLSDYNLSREQMALMPLLTPIAHIIVWMLPAIEIAIALLLFFPKTRLIGLYSITVLMIFFTAYIVFMMANYAHLPCSCGGFLEVLSWNEHLIFNCICISLCLLAVILLKKHATRNVEISN